MLFLIFTGILLNSLLDGSAAVKLCDQCDNSEHCERRACRSEHGDSQDSPQHSSRASQCFCSLLRGDAGHGCACVYFHLV